MTEDEQKIEEIGAQVQDEYQMGGLSSGLYMDFAKDVALRFSMHESKKYHAEKKELLRQIQSLQEEINTMKIKYKQSLIVLRDICKSARLEGGMNTANELLSEL